jgi:hypothetical protein
MEMANTPAYYITSTITANKSIKHCGLKMY